MAPPLAKSELRNKIKYRIVLIFFVSRLSDLKLRNLANLWPYDYDTVILQKVTYDVIFITSKDYDTENTSHNFFPFSSLSLSKILVALLKREFFG